MVKAKKTLLYIFSISALFLIQSVFSVGEFKLNLLILPVYYVGFKKGYLKGLLTGALIGFLEDSFSGIIIGPALLSKGVLGIAASYIRGGFFIWRPALGMISLFGLCLIDDTIRFISLAIFSDQPTTLKHFLIFALLRAIIISPVGSFIKPEDGR